VRFPNIVRSIISLLWKAKSLFLSLRDDGDMLKRNNTMIATSILCLILAWLALLWSSRPLAEARALRPVRTGNDRAVRRHGSRQPV